MPLLLKPQVVSRGSPAVPSAMRPPHEKPLEAILFACRLSKYALHGLPFSLMAQSMYAISGLPIAAMSAVSGRFALPPPPGVPSAITT